VTAFREWAKDHPRRVFALKAVILTVVLAVGFDMIARRYRLGIDWQVERCLPDIRVVLIDLRSEIPKRGELIAFRGLGLAPIFPDGTQMVKILVGLPGDLVMVSPVRTTVNGHEVARGFALAERLGQPPSAFARTFSIPAGHYFAVGRSAESFDSRYFGLIKDEQVLGKAWRLG
jgi:conjugal transfer pilin signal peptidase TrbI